MEFFVVFFEEIWFFDGNILISLMNIKDIIILIISSYPQFNSNQSISTAFSLFNFNHANNNEEFHLNLILKGIIGRGSNAACAGRKDLILGESMSLSYK